MSKQRPPINWTIVRHRVQASQAALAALLTPDEEDAQGVLRRRAQMLAQKRGEPARTPDKSAYLLVRARESLFAIDLYGVAEVGPVERCTPVPGGPARLVGVFAHRGEVHSLVDLGALLQAGARESVGLGYFVHVRPGGARGTAAGVWLLVDEPRQTVELAPSDVLAAEALEVGFSTQYVRGVTRDGVFVLKNEPLWEAGNAAPKAGSSTGERAA